MALRESAGFHNGAVWQAPNDLRIVLTWLDDNQWALMSEPERSRHGDYCVIPHSDINGQWLWEGNQLAARLDGWTYLPDQSLGPLISKSVAAPVPAREWEIRFERLWQACIANGCRTNVDGNNIECPVCRALRTDPRADETGATPSTSGG